MAKARILAVDDQQYFRSFLEEILTQEGYEAITASSGEEALALLEKEPFHVVLADLVMPGMGGSELVRRIRQRDHDQEVIVVTGVGDVRAALEAMKHGVTDYQLKPVDRVSLVRAIEALLQRRRLREEHARLLDENLEYLSVLSLYERALGLFSTLDLEALADRVVEGLCLETRAQGGVLWAARDEDSARLHLAGMRGLVRVQDETEQIVLDSASPELAAVAAGDVASWLAPARPGDDADSLFVPLRQGGRFLGLARLSDPLGGRPFGPRDVTAAEKFAGIAAQALVQALRSRTMERGALRDPETGLYSLAFFEDVARNEIEKASRFGRSVAVVEVRLDAASRAADTRRAARAVSGQIARCLRGSDMLAGDGIGRFCALLPETDAIGAAVLKRRIRELLELPQEGAEPLPRARIASASFPADGRNLESIESVLNRRLDHERESLLGALGLDRKPLAATLEALAARSTPLAAGLAEQVARFALDDVVRNPEERGFLFIAPGATLPAALRDAVERLRGLETRTEVVLLTDAPPDLTETPVTCLPAKRAGGEAAFVVRFGEGPAYALIATPDSRKRAPAVFHTGDRPLVEHLAFALQRELAITVTP